MCVCDMKTIQQTLFEISSENWTYHLPLGLIKVNNGHEIAGQKVDRRSLAPKGTSTPLRHVYVCNLKTIQLTVSEISSGNKPQCTTGQPDMVMTILRWRGIKMEVFCVRTLRCHQDNVWYRHQSEPEHLFFITSRLHRQTILLSWER